MRITGNTIIGDILDYDQGCTAIFSSFGMNCVDCPASRGETLREACELHEVDCAELISLLEARLPGK